MQKLTKRQIYVKFQKEGIHKYPDAPDEVSFLRHPHRHIFHFVVSISVEHHDRDLEFFIEKNFMEKLYDGGTLQLDYKSCEMMAEDLFEQISTRYAGRDIQIQVSEDDENGCILGWTADE